MKKLFYDQLHGVWNTPHYLNDSTKSECSSIGPRAGFTPAGGGGAGLGGGGGI